MIFTKGNKSSKTAGLILLLALYVSSCGSQKESASAGIAFRELSVAEAFEEAAREDKLVFVDAYADWCLPCRQMAKSVFTQAEVGRYFNEHFINLQVNTDKGEGIPFSRRYNITLLPTLLFLDPSGQVVYSAQGFKNPSDLLRLAEKAVSLYKPSASTAP